MRESFGVGEPSNLKNMEISSRGVSLSNVEWSSSISVDVSHTKSDVFLRPIVIRMQEATWFGVDTFDKLFYYGISNVIARRRSSRSSVPLPSLWRCGEDNEWFKLSLQFHNSKNPHHKFPSFLQISIFNLMSTK